jgi:hypothetical protein
MNNSPIPAPGRIKEQPNEIYAYTVDFTKHYTMEYGSWCNTLLSLGHLILDRRVCSPCHVEK